MENNMEFVSQELVEVANATNEIVKETRGNFGVKAAKAGGLMIAGVAVYKLGGLAVKGLKKLREPKILIKDKDATEQEKETKPEEPKEETK